MRVVEVGTTDRKKDEKNRGNIRLRERERAPSNKSNLIFIISQTTSQGDCSLRSHVDVVDTSHVVMTLSLQVNHKKKL